MKNPNKKESLPQAVILFFGVSHALRGESILKEAHLPGKLVPVPRQFSSDCGVCLRINREDGEKILALFTEKNLEYDGLRDLD